VTQAMQMILFLLLFSHFYPPSCHQTQKPPRLGAQGSSLVVPPKFGEHIIRRRTLKR
jgi:hypothetical protein